MGKGKFGPPVALKSLNGFRWNFEYKTTSWVCPHMQICGAATTWVVWANTWKNACCGLFGIPFFALFFDLLWAGTTGPILTIYMSYDVLPPKDVPFRVSFILLPILGYPTNTPILRAWIGIFKLNMQNIKICILLKLLHQLQRNLATKTTNTLRGWSQHA